MSPREHTAFLNLWLDHFLFNGPSLAPTKNYLNLANALANDQPLALGKLFLGILYRHLSLNTQHLLSNSPITTGGPWWFIQLWCRIYFRTHIPDFPSLTDQTFPSTSGKYIHYTSFGQALHQIPASVTDATQAAQWFKCFYSTSTIPTYQAFAQADSFENPYFFRLDSFATDDDTRDIFGIMITPCFLPVSMSTSNRINKPGYESYQPAFAARQFGLNQTSPHLIIHEKILSRGIMTDGFTASKAYNIFSEIKL